MQHIVDALQAEVLNVDLQQLQEAVSIACRLGFGTRREHLQPVASHLMDVTARTWDHIATA